MTDSEGQQKLNPKKRTIEAKRRHFDIYGFNARNKMTTTLPIFRPITAETTPSQAAWQIAFVLWLVTFAWFLFSWIIYGFILSYRPLPPGEGLNLALIFNSHDLGRTAVNIALSSFMNFCLWIQFLALSLYRWERTRRRAFKAHLKRGVIMEDYVPGLDLWDEPGYQVPHPIEARTRAQTSSGHGTKYYPSRTSSPSDSTDVPRPQPAHLAKPSTSLWDSTTPGLENGTRGTTGGRATSRATTNAATRSARTTAQRRTENRAARRTRLAGQSAL